MKKIKEQSNNVRKSVQNFAKCTELREWIKTKSEGMMYNVLGHFPFANLSSVMILL